MDAWIGSACLKRLTRFVLDHWRNGPRRAAPPFGISSRHAPGTVKVFDVNLRQSYYSPEVLSESMKLADIVKLNDDELPKIMSLKRFPHKDDVSSAQRLISTYDLKLLCITRGGRGSLLVRNGDSASIPDFVCPLQTRWDREMHLPRAWSMNICKALRWI